MYQRIKSLRGFKELQQGEFAEAIGLKQAHLSKIEQGKGKVPPEVLGRIILIYRVHHLWLLGVEGEDNEVMFKADETVVLKSELDRAIQDCDERLKAKDIAFNQEREERLKVVAKVNELMEKLYEGGNSDQS